MKLKSIIIVFCVVCLTAVATANQHAIDSLVNLTKVEKKDSVLLQLYNSIGSMSNREDEQLSRKYWAKALELATQKVKENRSIWRG